MQKDNINYRLSCLKKYGRNSLSHLTLSNSLSTFCGDWKGYIAYNIIFKCAIVLGDPIVPADSLEQAIRDLKEWAKSKKLLICIVCTQNGYESFEKQGFKRVCWGYEPITNLNKFNLKGPKKSNIRNNINHAVRNNLIVEEYKYISHRNPHIEKEIQRISNEWCQIKKIQEPIFLTGKADFENNYGTRYFICKYNKKIVGFLKYAPIFGGNSYYLENGRRGLNSPRGTIDYLLVKSFEKFSREGIEKVNFGPLPYAILPRDITTYSHLSEKLFVLLRPVFELVYPVESQYFIKNRYATCWEPSYIYYFPHLNLRMLLSLIHYVYPGGLASIFLQQTKYNLKKTIMYNK
jgi:phosphatidylglycerol lysyltransferase